jgi:polyhydroxybutyrate depolymerase
MNRPLYIIVQTVIEVLLFCGCAWAGSTDDANDHTYSIAVDALNRQYVVHIPQGYVRTKPWPVVIMFHGGGGHAAAAMSETGWTRKADDEGFLAVFPEGTRPDPTRPARFRGNPQSWNDGSNRRNVRAVMRDVPDVAFAKSMIADIKMRFNVDDRRIYVTGFSNGASMTFRVARELSSMIAAAAPVAGADWMTDVEPEHPVPLLYITGDADPLNPIHGGEIHIGATSYGVKPATETMIDNWVAMLGLPHESHTVYDQDGALGVAYSRPNSDDEVMLYTIAGHGHHWPGGNSMLPAVLAGPNTAKLNATDVIWDFFKRHTKAQ